MDEKRKVLGGFGAQPNNNRHIIARARAQAAIGRVPIPVVQTVNPAGAPASTAQQPSTGHGCPAGPPELGHRDRRNSLDFRKEYGSPGGNGAFKKINTSDLIMGPPLAGKGSGSSQ
jgi:hypothetical protein